MAVETGQRAAEQSPRRSRVIGSMSRPVVPSKPQLATSVHIAPAAYSGERLNCVQVGRAAFLMVSNNSKARSLSTETSHVDCHCCQT